jgi:hypothetical protein
VKTDNELVAMALEMAAEDKNAIIMFVLPTYAEARHFLSLAKQSPAIGEGVVQLQCLQVDFPSGGRVLFRSLSFDSRNAWGGYQYSHAFVPRRIGSECEDVVRSKLRYRYPVSRAPIVPSGIYRPWYVERNHYYGQEGKHGKQVGY